MSRPAARHLLPTLMSSLSLPCGLTVEGHLFDDVVHGGGLGDDVAHPHLVENRRCFPAWFRPTRTMILVSGMSRLRGEDGIRSSDDPPGRRSNEHDGFHGFLFQGLELLESGLESLKGEKTVPFAVPMILNMVEEEIVRPEQQVFADEHHGARASFQRNRKTIRSYFPAMESSRAAKHMMYSCSVIGEGMAQDQSKMNDKLQGFCGARVRDRRYLRVRAGIRAGRARPPMRAMITPFMVRRTVRVHVDQGACPGPGLGSEFQGRLHGSVSRNFLVQGKGFVDDQVASGGQLSRLLGGLAVPGIEQGFSRRPRRRQGQAGAWVVVAHCETEVESWRAGNPLPASIR